MIYSSETLKLMGNRFVITAAHNQIDSAKDAVQVAIAEISRIENLLSTFKADSETNLINASAGLKPVSVSLEIIHLIERSIKISTLTGGAFDISYGSAEKSFWNFDKSMTTLPDQETVLAAAANSNFRDIEINHAAQTVFLKKKGIRIGFGGIGKGYAADMAATKLQNLGIKHGLINASGDLYGWGKSQNGKPWTISLAHPDQKWNPFSDFEINNMAVATSGNYEKYVVINHKKYAHTIDPRTGWPVSGIKSVSVVAPKAEIADAFTKPITVLGVEKGLALINSINGLGCIIINEENKIFTSDNINHK